MSGAEPSTLAIGKSKMDSNVYTFSIQLRKNMELTYLWFKTYIVFLKIQWLPFAKEKNIAPTETACNFAEFLLLMVFGVVTVENFRETVRYL